MSGSTYDFIVIMALLCFAGAIVSLVLGIIEANTLSKPDTKLDEYNQTVDRR